MTFTKTITMTYGNFFLLFYKYWDIKAVEILTSHIFVLLQIEWDKNKWDSEELKHICYALDAKFEDLNPNYFIRKEFAYLDRVKMWFYLQEHDD